MTIISLLGPQNIFINQNTVTGLAVSLPYPTSGALAGSIDQQTVQNVQSELESMPFACLVKPVM